MAWPLQSFFSAAGSGGGRCAQCVAVPGLGVFFGGSGSWSTGWFSPGHAAAGQDEHTGLSSLKDFFTVATELLGRWRRVDQTNLLPPIVQLLYFFWGFFFLISWTLKHA